MHEWLVFLHVAAVLGFMLAHGVQVTAMWKMRWEPDPEQNLTLLNVLPGLTLVRVMLAAVVISGLLVAFTGSWWDAGWLWLSLLILAVVAVAMWRYGGGYYGLIQDAATKALEARDDPASQPAAQQTFDAARRSWHPMGMTVIGLGGVGVILWLMMFKPF